VSAADLFHLQPSEFLNDTVIDLYLKKLERVRNIHSLLMCALRYMALHRVLTTHGAPGAVGADEQARAFLQHLLLQETGAEAHKD
jgi:hypothetical protein